MASTRSAVLAAVLSALCSCSEFRGALEFDENPLGSTYDYVNPYAGNHFRKQYRCADDRAAERNRILYELMGIIDDDFSKFERDLRSDRAYKDVLVAWTSISLTGVASLATTGVANILAAVDTGLKGANEAVDRNAFREKGPELLINTMRAQRARVAKNIYERMRETDAQYPLEAGLRDVVHYYHAGFVTAALAALAEETAKDAAESEKAANDAFQSQRKSADPNVPRTRA